MNDTPLSHRQKQLRNLVVMALADGSIGQREVELVADRCLELGLGQDELQSAIAYGLGDDASLDLPVSESEREELLIDLIRMMAADGYLAEAEKRLFALAAAHVNITGERLQRLISDVVANPPPTQRKDESA